MPAPPEELGICFLHSPSSLSYFVRTRFGPRALCVWTLYFTNKHCFLTLRSIIAACFSSLQVPLVMRIEFRNPRNPSMNGRNTIMKATVLIQVQKQIPAQKRIAVLMIQNLCKGGVDDSLASPFGWLVSRESSK